jgi:hypothetical protein
MRKSLLLLALVMALASGKMPCAHTQSADVNFNANVTHPAYPKKHVRVLFDEAHNNAETSAGRYKPFTDLIVSDGCNVVSGREALSRKTLKGYTVLVIANASGPNGHREASAFTQEECDAVRDWVSSGGALLLITDHAPFGTAIGELAKRFGIDVTIGYTIDKVHYNKGSDDQTEIIFTREAGLLGDHAITKGRGASESINRVVTFSGTSLKGPNNSVAFLKLSDTAFDVVPPEVPSEAKPRAPEEPLPEHKPVSAAGKAQGIALEFGKGRVVVLGEAAMLTAQTTGQGLPFGMNVPGIDNRQLALNIMHWLSGLLR